MERIIGVFGSLIKQLSNPFANLSEQAKKVAEVNAIIAVWPSLERVKKDPRGSVDIGSGYILLGPKDDRPYYLSAVEKDALGFYFNEGSVPRESVYRWARLQIPNGQVARSYWKEAIRTSDGARTDRNVKVCYSVRSHFSFTNNINIGPTSRDHPLCGSTVLLSGDNQRYQTNYRPLFAVLSSG